MVGIILISHGNLAEVIRQTAEGIIGKQENVITLSTTANQSMEQIKENITKAVKQLNQGEGILILTDLLGGTACNLSLPLVRDNNIEIVSGMNLYGVISAFQNRNLPLKDLTAKVIYDSRKSIQPAKEVFFSKLNADKTHQDR